MNNHIIKLCETIIVLPIDKIMELLKHAFSWEEYNLISGEGSDNVYVYNKVGSKILEYHFLVQEDNKITIKQHTIVDRDNTANILEDTSYEVVYKNNSIVSTYLSHPPIESVTCNPDDFSEYTKLVRRNNVTSLLRYTTTGDPLINNVKTDLIYVDIDPEHRADNFPDWIETRIVDKRDGYTIESITCNSGYPNPKDTEQVVRDDDIGNDRIEYINDDNSMKITACATGSIEIDIKSLTKGFPHHIVELRCDNVQCIEGIVTASIWVYSGLTFDEKIGYKSMFCGLKTLIVNEDGELGIG